MSRDALPSEQALMAHLSRLPEMEPPAEMVARVMARVDAMPGRRFGRVRAWLARPMHIRLRPAYGLVAVLGITLLVWGGWIYTGRMADWSSQAAQAEYQYVTGRSLLAHDEPAAALTHLQRAVDRQPDNADYQFWLGVAFWASGDARQEARHYQRALDLNPRLMPARLYLAHNRLDAGDPQQAVQLYRQVLKQEPQHEDALYNLAVAFSRQHQKEAAAQAFTRFLDLYPSGQKAVQAVRGLQRLGIHEYQLVPLGNTVTTIRPLTFAAGSAILTPAARETLERIAELLQQQPAVRLNVVVFEADALARARNRAQAIKTHLLSRSKAIHPDRIVLSWFDRQYTVQNGLQQKAFSSMVRVFGVHRNQRAMDL